jgi:hypothetical protein
MRGRNASVGSVSYGDIVVALLAARPGEDGFAAWIVPPLFAALAAWDTCG